MMALGEFRFSLATAAFQDLERNNEWRWPTQDRIGSKPARQFVGEGDDTISLNGVIYPHFRAQRAGLSQVSQMREIAGRGLPLTLVDGSGRVWGEYCILTLREGQKVFFSDGRPRSITFDLSLGAYGGGVAAPITISVAAASDLAPPLPTPANFRTAVDAVTISSPSVITQIASKMALAQASARELVGMTRSGIAEIGGVIATGQAAIQAVTGGDSSAMGAVDSLRRSALAVSDTFDLFVGDVSRKAFLNAGHDLDGVFAAARVDGVTPLSRLLDTVNAIDSSAPTADPFIHRIITDPDARAVVSVLQAERA